MTTRTPWISLGQEVIRCWQRVTSAWPGNSRSESPEVKTSCGKNIEHATRSSFSGNRALDIVFETRWDERVTRVREHTVYRIRNRLGRTSHESLPDRPWLGMGESWAQLSHMCMGENLSESSAGCCSLVLSSCWGDHAFLHFPCSLFLSSYHKRRAWNFTRPKIEKLRGAVWK